MLRTASEQKPAIRGKMTCPFCLQSGIALMAGKDADPHSDRFEEHQDPRKRIPCKGGGKTIRELTS